MGYFHASLPVRPAIRALNRDRLSSYGLFASRFGPHSGLRHITIPTFLLPPATFVGLVLALYTWKSFMMVSLQNKIIYNPYLPPSARHDKISDYTKYLYGIDWKEIHMKSSDRTDLALAVASVSSESNVPWAKGVAYHVYILYCQGNASSLPPRLTDHSWILRKLKTNFGEKYPEFGKVRFTEVCVSYRGYWTSSGRPSEIGINNDTRAAVDWISQLHGNTYPESGHGSNKTKPIFLIWGQSIGSGFVTNLAAAGTIPLHLEPSALILETPFLSVRDMLEALYPEKWLPYKYLYPFLRNHLDSHRNLGTIAAHRAERGLKPPQIFILQAGRDEIVPEKHAEALRARCAEVGIPQETRVMPRAYHNDAIAGGRAHIADFVMKHTAEVILRERSE
ncbi:Alpha/Beta hydrolase protein [Coniella lustricola]|uniref:Alpha/Beta hydrolase protein n=1 Tax=Coniella lustricola TaxID=2025994 RepID=A0A2T3AEK9_9PEZI|nr:Alpha/Beta hydrolase protein [Coniella lustricola]